ncbi:ER degradation-enhancing alpha-mannosidase-like 2 precursor [Anopheles sinensis]|uniref:ER degradation-enhancing alpha-mannosidase-like 2 n=1 Tax=Anopheles sinensis TaxID=74873 RepID=A0A084VQ61_ANOSI|nr:ER degradation-enhancing alpha-mannosidase-like 2 precursor [Anopheles sinensis]
MTKRSRRYAGSRKPGGEAQERTDDGGDAGAGEATDRSSRLPSNGGRDLLVRAGYSVRQTRGRQTRKTASEKRAGTTSAGKRPYNRSPLNRRAPCLGRPFDGFISDSSNHQREEREFSAIGRFWWALGLKTRAG